MNERNYTILKYLKENGEYVTSENLSALCNVSTKTILKDIKLINEDMKSTKNYIDVKTSQGLKLLIMLMNLLIYVIPIALYKILLFLVLMKEKIGFKNI